eukprot:TCALIF_02778-PA protein Name:"Similar to Zfp26 Zinc finger protein 26 (Mus musculus)" AED:0.10 eAED:0.11 QI:493/0.33/0.28/0.71/0.5/0.28/7/0/1223
MGEHGFSCDKCPRTFKLEEFFEKHKKVHELKKQHVCEVCGFVYGAAKGLEGHLKTHSDEEIVAASSKGSPKRDEENNPPYSMDFRYLQPFGVLTSAGQPKPPAPRSEKSNSTETEDLKVSPHGGTGSYEIYDSVPDMNDVTLVSQNDNGFFSCCICKREFSGLNSLKKHLPIHTRKVQHACDICGHVFGKKEYLLDHMRKHTGEVSPICEVCDQTFNKTLKLKEHMKIHRNFHADGTVNTVLPFRCHICREVFQQAKVLNNHLTSTHASETLYNCDLCQASFGDVRSKNHHMYNVHQVDSFNQKCVWCPICHHGFTRQYNLKVHLLRAHGKEYSENNFTKAEWESITKPSGQSGTPSPMPPTHASLDGLSNKDKQAILIQHASNPIFKANLERVVANGSKPVTHYFDQLKGTQIFSCQTCQEKFHRKSDLFIHLEHSHQLPVFSCTSCGEKFMDFVELRDHITTAHLDSGKPIQIRNGDDPPMMTIKPISTNVSNGNIVKPKRRPGPASKTNAPIENRMVSTNLPSHLEAALEDNDGNGYPCKDCGKVLQHKQSYVSHMRVIHGSYYGGNKWKGSSVVDMILEESVKMSPKKRVPKGSPDANATICSVCEQVFPNPSSLRNHVVNVHINGQSHTCDLCGKAFLSQENLDAHTQAKHPNLHKRLQSLRDALGLAEDTTAKLDGQLPRLTHSLSNLSQTSSGISSLSDEKSSSLPSTSPPGSNRKKNSICKVCGVVLSPKTNVNVHMRTHSGARPYQCVLCLNKFRQKAHLMKHFRCSHNQKRPPFICLFCPDECQSSNDLYRHITDKHKKETDELIKLNGLQAPPEEDHIQIETDTLPPPIKEEVVVPQPLVVQTPPPIPPQLKQIQEPLIPPPRLSTPKSEIEVGEIRIREEEEEDDEEDDIRYEPITEPFLFEREIIHPCYVVLPFVTDQDIEVCIRKSANDFFKHNEEDDREEGELTIDESHIDEDHQNQVKRDGSPVLESLLQKTTPLPPALLNEFLQKKKESLNAYNAEDISLGIQNPAFYPNLGDFSLPFSLSSLWKKKIDVIHPETIRQLEMMEKIEQIKQLNAPMRENINSSHNKPKPASKKRKPEPPVQDDMMPLDLKQRKLSDSDHASNDSTPGTSTQVSEYEVKIQNDYWPVDCIKCNVRLDGLDNFNLHMNDHWSDDKCCPVCGLLINSKRFNFKQHLKIHTGEKPFTCNICNRSFRQKAHMIKHITTHRQN